jgi:hypothetical protein
MFFFQERDFDKHVAYCQDEPLAQEFLQENDAARDYFEVSLCSQTLNMMKSMYGVCLESKLNILHQRTGYKLNYYIVVEMHIEFEVLILFCIL